MSGNGRSTQGPGEAALRAAVSEGLAPGSWGHRGALSASSGANFLFGRENRKTLAGNGLLPAVPFLRALACGEKPHGWVSPPHPSPWESTRGHGPLCYDSKPYLTRILSLGVATGQMFSVRFYTSCWAPGPAAPPLSAPRAHGILGVPSTGLRGPLDWATIRKSLSAATHS